MPIGTALIFDREWWLTGLGRAGHRAINNLIPDRPRLLLSTVMGAYITVGITHSKI